MTQQVNPSTTTTTSPEYPDRPQTTASGTAAAVVRTWLRDVDRDQLRDRARHYAPWALGVLGLAAAALLVWIVGSAFQAVVEQQAWLQILEWPLVRTITESIGNYLTDHATGLPATPEQIGKALASTAGLLWVLSALGYAGARLAWLVVGPVAVTMAWAGAPIDSGPVAAVITAAAWSLLTAVAIHGLRHPMHIHTHHHDRACRADNLHERV